MLKKACSKDYGECIYCGGEIAEELVQKVCSRQGHPIAVIDEVPAGVCTQCGERFYKSSVMERIEAILADIHRNSKFIQLPFAKYAA